MKKTTILCTVASLIAFGAGWFTNQKVTDYKSSCEWPYYDTLEANMEYHKASKKYCVELLDVQYNALQKADSIIDNNDLLDTDGSDTMAEYLELRCKVDSLMATQL